jgi:hypothetical protein
MSDSNPEKVKALKEAWNLWNKELMKPAWAEQNLKGK